MVMVLLGNDKKNFVMTKKCSTFAISKKQRVLSKRLQTKGSLAQLVQSTCLTSKGSLVRIQ